MKNRDCMFKILNELNKHDIILQYYEAHSTDSCYIKLDWGVSGSIRVANHKGIEKYNYRFNLMLNLDKSYKDGDRYYYCLSDYDIMIKDTLEYVENQKDKYGFKYFEYMVNNKNDAVNKKGFWQYSKQFN